MYSSRPSSNLLRSSSARWPHGLDADDQWEGQRWNRSPGNLFSTPKRITLDLQASSIRRCAIRLSAHRVAQGHHSSSASACKPDADKFWGHPISSGHRTSAAHYKKNDISYPVLYAQGHFSTAAPLQYEPKSNRGITPIGSRTASRA